MDHFIAVRGVECLCDLGCNDEGSIEGNGTALQTVGEVSPSRSSITRKATPSCWPTS
jgi:hypothetical protein